ncbi:GATOR complex protein depdc5 [Homalodisca vitripennis]|nr:GATOR complex protein depdc5 [Homalodisca vitripennis]
MLGFYRVPVSVVSGTGAASLPNETTETKTECPAPCQCSCTGIQPECMCSYSFHLEQVEDLIINPKDFPTLRKGDIVEIYHPEDEFSRLLLQINSFKEDLQGRETISVEQSIATTFQLRTYADVIVTKVDPVKVALDSVELTFKDQYMGRSEMWRLKSNMVNTCVYLHKKIEFCGGSNRCQVYQMWASGDKVSCGVINEDTKVVFRSSTSMVYIFVQMSSEMWEFDLGTDVYFERAVHGFLTELFTKWKKLGTNHEVTIVLYTRVFYLATTAAEFPKYMLEGIQQDYKGRFYEDFYRASNKNTKVDTTRTSKDQTFTKYMLENLQQDYNRRYYENFYRVAVQNERYDDWSHILNHLHREFKGFKEMLLTFHNRSDIEIPMTKLASSHQGNFLEVINISLNVRYAECHITVLAVEPAEIRIIISVINNIRVRI